MRKTLYTLAGLFVVVGLVWAQTIHRRTERFDFVNGIRSSAYSDMSGNSIVIAGENGETINNATDGTFDFTRDDAGTVTITASDDDSTAALTVLPGGAAALTLGGASTTTVTVTTDSTGDAEVVLPNSSIGGGEIAGALVDIYFCGQNDENGTVYIGPVTNLALRETIGSTACDALDSATESTADAPLGIGTTIYPKMLSCYTDGTLGSGETLAFQLRSAEASVTGTACSLTEAQTACSDLSTVGTSITASATLAVSVIQASNNSDDNSLCILRAYVQ